MRNFENFKEVDFTLNPSVSLLKQGINRLFKGTKSYSFFQLKSLSQIWLRGLKKMKKIQNRSKN